MTKKILLFSVLFHLLFFVCKSQVSDDFSDGNFSENPCWRGDTNSFIINSNKELQLIGNEEGEAYLATASLFGAENMEWRFRIKLAFSPSGSNFSRLYLLSEQDDIMGDLSGCYYLQLGEALNQDAIELFYQSDSNSYSICRGTDGKLSNVFDYNIKVLKTGGHWQIHLDEERNGYYALECEGDAPHTATKPLLGIYCKFTNSNNNRFFFDDFYVGPPIIDSIAPRIERIELGNDLHQIKVLFSENTSLITSLLPTNYRIIENGWNPNSCCISQGGQHCVMLNFENPFTIGEKYHLECRNISDQDGNVLSCDTIEFYWKRIERNDIIINEIMSDPYPEVGLPSCEYIEIYNRSEQSISLAHWKLQYGSNYRELSIGELLPHSYGLIVQMGQEVNFASENIFAVSSLNVSDGGQFIGLIDDFGNIVHCINFKREWHDEIFKRDGGWSLEMMDSDNPCGGSENWGSSTALTGGTPGEVNSIAKENPDASPPELLHVTVKDSQNIKIFFNESLITDSTKIKKALKIDHGIEVTGIQKSAPLDDIIEARLSTGLEEGKIYTLSIIDTLSDCSGLTVLAGSQSSFGLPQKALKGDIVINEVLSNPLGTSDADYIELYNRSEKIIDLSEVRIGVGGDRQPEKSCIIAPGGKLFFPYTYLAVCKNKKLTEEQYLCRTTENLWQADSLPNYANGSGIVHVTDPQYENIDKFIYDESMHYALLNDLDGVALERVHPNLNTQDANNWTSAAESCGFGTPGRCNSQYAEVPPDQSILEIHPEIFSPDQDGFDDFVEFHCQFEETENRVSIAIFDRRGYCIKQISNNQLCGMTEHFRWDGLTEKGTLAAPDLYIIKMQYWNSSGKSKQVKKIVGIAKK